MENEERASDVVEPTVTAAATLAGEELHALAFELPAAIEYVMPSLIELTGRGYLDLLVGGRNGRETGFPARGVTSCAPPSLQVDAVCRRGVGPVSFTAPAGTFVAVTGGDRTGKSTVVGVFPTSCFPPFDAAIPLAAQDRTLPQLPARPPSGSGSV